MASFLEKQLRDAIAQGFKGKLLVGTLSRTSSVSTNSHGDPVLGSPVSYTVEGFVDSYNDVFRAQAGIPETDVKLVIILGNSQTEPLKDDKVAFPNWGTYQIRKVKIDPAKATAECQSYRV